MRCMVRVVGAEGGGESKVRMNDVREGPATGLPLS